MAPLNFDLADTAAGQDLINLGVLLKGREVVIEILEIRFGQVPSEVSDAINELVDLSRLKTLHRQALLIKSIDEFVAALEQTQNPT
ncbi:MAG: hypothetical protein HQK56_14310 [Deltaproteobacteria bacterium]|nr:hypothetical protein [Deltaproteobacteria bacterium]